MSHKSKSIIASMVSGVALLVAYAFYAARPEIAEQSLQSWAVAILVFIGIGIAATIIIQIVFHIVLATGIAISQGGKDSDEIQRILSSTMTEDEMDRMISLRATHVGSILAGIAFIAVVAILALGASAIVALNVLFVSFAAGSLISGGVSIHAYERGVRNA